MRDILYILYMYGIQFCFKFISSNEKILVKGALSCRKSSC